MHYESIYSRSKQIEMDMPVAYLILAHTDPRQCQRLVKSLLEDPSAQIFLHVDLKSRNDFSSVLQLDAQRVHMVKERWKVYWAGFNMVRATLSAMQQAINHSQFGYFVLLSGQDYPIKHAAEIRSYFYNQQFRQHINRINILDSTEHYLKSATHYYFRDGWLPWAKLDKVVRKLATIAAHPIRRKLLPGMPCTGSSWWALTSECVRYILDFVELHPEYERFYRYVYAPDEDFFHTIIQNSRFFEEAPPVLPYTGRGMWKTANFHIVHPSLKKIYTENDYEEVVQSDRCFVRKVTSAESSVLMDKIDTGLGRSMYTLPDTQGAHMPC